MAMGSSYQPAGSSRLATVMPAARRRSFETSNWLPPRSPQPVQAAPTVDEFGTLGRVTGDDGLAPAADLARHS